MANATFSQTFNSFCGVDMLVTFGNEIIGEVQGLSYTITREKAMSGRQGPYFLGLSWCLMSSQSRESRAELSSN